MVFEVTIVSIKEEYLIVDRGGAVYVGELGHVLKSPVSIHVAIRCVMDFPVQWNIVMEILGVLLGLAKNDGRQVSFTISLDKVK